MIQTFLTHALRDGYFHADMHQGNLKLGPDGALVALDFGIMGRIDAYTRRVYAEILYGFLRRDYARVAEVHFEAGYVPRDRDPDAFAQALRSVGEPIFGQDATRISMARLLAHLFEVTERFGMQTRTELILLQRTMVVVEGVGRALNPQMNMWETARPVVTDYIRTNLGPQAVARELAATVRILSRLGPRLPQMAEAALIRASTPAPAPERRRVPGWAWGLGGADGRARRWWRSGRCCREGRGGGGSHAGPGGVLDVVVVGGGFAGLAVSGALKAAGLGHVVFEKSRPCQPWLTQRWDSFRMNTPNLLTVMPGEVYRGPEPEGAMTRDEFVASVLAYAEGRALPLESGTAVSSVEPDGRGASRCAPRRASSARATSSPPPATSTSLSARRSPPGCRGRHPDQRLGLPQRRGPATGRGAGGRLRQLGRPGPLRTWRSPAGGSSSRPVATAGCRGAIAAATSSSGCWRTAATTSRAPRRRAARSSARRRA